jgi:uncharacterized protein YndB with AHSA1/START domain
MNDETLFDPGPLADVDAEPAADRWTLVLVRELRHLPEKVWIALTDPAQLEAWAPYIADRDLGTVGEATLTMVDGDTREDIPVTVLRADPPRLLEHTWGPDLLRWELEPTGTGTRLTLRHTVADKDLVAKVAAGWHLCLVVAERLLDGHPIPPIRGEAAKDFGWEGLRDAYEDRLEG